MLCMLLVSMVVWLKSWLNWSISILSMLRRMWPLVEVGGMGLG